MVSSQYFWLTVPVDPIRPRPQRRIMKLVSRLLQRLPSLNAFRHLKSHRRPGRRWRPLRTSVAESLEVRCLLAANLVTDVNPRPGGVAISQFDFTSAFVESGGVAYFAADTPGHGSELWKTDGTAEGTQMVVELRSGAAGSRPKSLRNIDGQLYFTATDDLGGAVWRTDGTAAGTERMADSSSHGEIVSFDDRTVFFQGRRSELVKTDPDFTLTEVLPVSSAQFLTVSGGLLYFQGFGATGQHLWASDGTPDGTYLVREINADSRFSSMSALTDVNGTLFFVADDGVHGSELWKSDGTEEGTVMVTDIGPGSSMLGVSLSSPLAVLNGEVYFSATHTGEFPNGTLWKSDGTPEGTIPVSPTRLDGLGISPSLHMTVLGERLNFFVGGSSLWSTDGTENGTVPVLSAGVLNAPNSPTIVDDHFFWADHNKLWVSDGTADGSVLVKTFDGSDGLGFPPQLATLNGNLIFAANDGVHGRELWISDGTTDGTQIIADIVTATADSTRSGREIVEAGDAVYFTESGTSQHVHLWKRTSATNGATLISSSLQIDNLIDRNGTLYFRKGSHDGTEWISEIWKVDASIGAESTLVASSPDFGFNPSLLQVDARILVAADEKLWRLNESVTPATFELINEFPGRVFSFASTGPTAYFWIFDSSTRTYTFWESDGTVAGTRSVDVPQLKDIHPESPGPIAVGNEIFMVMTADNISRSAIWRSDGTVNGTSLVTGLSTANVFFISDLTYLNGKLYFTAVQSFDGDREFWKHDLATGQTSRFNPGVKVPSRELETPQLNLTAIGNQLIFTANDGVHGDEVWISNGTDEGTMLLADVFPGAGGSAANSYAVHDGLLYFSATDDLHGEEVFTIDLSAPRLISLLRRADTEQVTNPAAVTFRASFTEPVSGVNVGTFGIDGTTTASITGVTVVAGSGGTQYDVTVSGGDLSRFRGRVGLNLDAPDGVTDGDGKVLLETEPTRDEAYVVHYVPPAPVIAPDSISEPNSQPTFTWPLDNQFTHYEVWLSRIDVNRGRVSHDFQVTGESWSPQTPLTPGRYRFWIRGTDAEGGRSAWSRSTDLRVNLSLVDQPVTSNGQPEFRWEPVPNTTYELFLRTTTGDIVHKNLVSTSFIPAVPLPVGPILWWVRASDSVGRRTPWSVRHETRSDGVTIVTAPTGATNGLPVFEWRAVSDVSRYILYVGRDGQGGAVFRADELTTTSFTLTDPLASGKYRVWVKAISTDSGFVNRWSLPIRFEVV